MMPKSLVQIQPPTPKMTDYQYIAIEVFDEKTILMTIDRDATVVKQYLAKKEALNMANELIKIANEIE